MTTNVGFVSEASALARAFLDLCLVMPGHVRVLRRPWMQDIAARYASSRGLSAACFLGALNATVRARRRARTGLYLNFRFLRSRFAGRLRREPVCATGAGRTISLLCPTRQRVRQACEFVTSVRRTATCPGRIEVLFYVDDDDPTRHEYVSQIALETMKVPALSRCEVIIGKPGHSAVFWNALGTASKGDLLAISNDDQVYADYGWDEALDRAAAEFSDDIFCLYLEGPGSKGRADFPIVSRRWYETVGYLIPEGLFRFWGIDNWILDIAQRIGRLKAVRGFLVDHLHYTQFTAPFDATYQRHRLTRDKSMADRATFRHSGSMRLDAVNKLQVAIAASAGKPVHPPKVRRTS